MISTTHRPGRAWACLVLLWLLACPALALAQSRPSSRDWDEDAEESAVGERLSRRGLQPEIEGLRNLDWGLAVVVVGGGTGLFIGVLYLLHQRRIRPRSCAQCHQPRRLLSEEEEDDHLEVGEQVEEKMGSTDYDVWWCDHCHDVEVLPHKPLYTPYASCERCQYNTVKQFTTPLPSGAWGTRYVQVTLECQSCHHSVSFKRRQDDP